MRVHSLVRGLAVSLALTLCSIGAVLGSQDETAGMRQAIDAAAKAIIEQHGIAGLAVGVTVNGKRFFAEYGSASRDPDVPVTRETLFELGSISKTFTATLAAYAQADGKLSLDGTVGQYMADLSGSAIGNVRLRDLATHTAGGFPLQLPDGVNDKEQLTGYFRSWKPQFAPGTYRTYANPSIGLLGVVAARAFGGTFDTVVRSRLFEELGLQHTFVNVPPQEMSRYAWGYTRDNKPIRVASSMLADEAYGIKSNAVDMIRFLELNMGLGTVAPKLADALRATHVGYYRSGELIQDLVWEQYPYPVEREKMIAGNSPDMLKPTAASLLDPPMAPRSDVIINKTGSTNGFGAYVAFVPGRRVGIVLLANKNYPNAARVTAALQILSRVAE